MSDEKAPWWEDERIVEAGKRLDERRAKMVLFTATLPEGADVGVVNEWLTHNAQFSEMSCATDEYRTIEMWVDIPGMYA